MGIDDTSTRSTAELAEKLASTDTVRAAYLADQGKSLEPVKMDKVWDKFGNDTLQKVVDRLGVNTLAGIEANLETGESVKDALGENAEVIRDILRDYYREQGEPMLRRMAVKRHWTDAEINERRQTRIDNSMDGVSIFTLEGIVHHAWDMYQDGGATKGEIDRMATSDALRRAVDDHAVEEWIAGKLDGLLREAGIYNGKDPYTPSGNLRSFSQLHYAYTLENIVKAMKEGQEERGGNTWGASAKTLQSVATPEYRSIQDNYYKLRDIGDALGFAVDWDPEGVVVIRSAEKTTDDSKNDTSDNNNGGNNSNNNTGNDGQTAETAASWTFNGAGWGHSVGMSQWGAYAMAKQGFSYEDILKFYFTGIEVSK